MNILIVDDDSKITTLLSEFVQTLGYNFKTASTGTEALATFESDNFDLILLDLFLPGMDGIEVLKVVKQSDRLCEVIMITAYGSIPSAVKALGLGAYAYIRKPFDILDLQHTIKRVEEVIELRKAYKMLTRERLKSYHFDSLVAYSSPMKKVKANIKRLIKSKDNVIVSGGPGVGKNFAAQTIHFNSESSAISLIKLNPKNVVTLVETGSFEHPDGISVNTDDFLHSLARQGCGAVLIPRISDLSPDHQDQLAEIIKAGSIKYQNNGHGKFCRIYGLTETSSSKSSPKKLLQPELSKLFKKNVHLPLLRERVEDILPLSQMFLQKIAHENANQPRQLVRPVQEFMRMYSWPGNIQELYSLISYIASTSKSQMINIGDLRRVHKEFKVENPEELLSLDNLLTLAEKQTIKRIFSSPGPGAH